MIPAEFLQIAEGLNHLDPIRTYPSRAAKLVAELAQARGFRVHIEGDDARHVDSTPPPPADGRSVSFPLRHGRQSLGTLDLFLPENGKLDGDELRVTRWAVRALSRGLSYTNRMNRPTGQDMKRKNQEVLSRLERTPLTKREREVVALLVGGATTRGIAEQTKLTVATVHTYLKRIYSKLGVHSRVELVARMVGTVGSVPPPEDESYQAMAVDPAANPSAGSSAGLENGRLPDNPLPSDLGGAYAATTLPSA